MKLREEIVRMVDLSEQREEAIGEGVRKFQKKTRQIESRDSGEVRQVCKRRSECIEVREEVRVRREQLRPLLLHAVQPHLAPEEQARTSSIAFHHLTSSVVRCPLTVTEEATGLQLRDRSKLKKQLN